MCLVVIDIGNTNTKLGVFAGDVYTKHWSVATNKFQTMQQVKEQVEMLFQDSAFDARQVEGISISSVVPAMLTLVEGVCRALWPKITPLVAGPTLRGWLPVDYENPQEVGRDRIVQAIAALHFFQPPLLVVGMGTATTVCVLDETGRYLGGMILPGFQIAAEALVQKAALLPDHIALEKPERVVGQTTVSGLRSGVYYGAVGQVDGVVRRICQAYGKPFTVVATGGLSELLAPESETIQHVHPRLLMEGLRILWELNRGKGL